MSEESLPEGQQPPAPMTEQPTTSPPAKPSVRSGIRASDEDRERLASDLREHAVAGRLDTDELEDRIQATYAARTTAELDELRRDLPATTREAALSHRARRSNLTRRMIQESGGSLVAFMVATGVWAASGASAPFWPVWVLLLVVITFARSAWALYGPAPDLDRVERHLDRQRDRDRRHHRRDRSGRRPGPPGPRS
jgi:DNA segregation ATPase FtsK/SpoIIIE-like protein